MEKEALTDQMGNEKNIDMNISLEGEEQPQSEQNILLVRFDPDNVQSSSNDKRLNKL